MANETVSEVDEITRFYTTLEGDSVKVLYNMEENTWEFKINRRTMVRGSLLEAKQAIEQYQKDERIKKAKVTFEKFKALYVGDVPWRLGYETNGFVKECEVVGLKESNKGSGVFNLAVLEFEGGVRSQLLLKRNENLVFKSEENKKVIEKFLTEKANLEIRRKEIEEEIEAWQKKLGSVDSLYGPVKNGLSKLVKITEMDEFDWSVMSMREKRSQEESNEVNKENS
jgi:hypothetical protein